MDGLCAYSKSREFPGPIEAAVSHVLRKYWLVSTQSGPFRITDKPNFRQLDDEIDSFTVDVPQFRDTDTSLFRRGIFPKLANILVIDEWTYLLALNGPEEEAVKIAVELVEGEWLSSKFFEVVESKTLGFFLYASGFWEIYLPDHSLHANLGRLGFGEIQSTKWLKDRHR
jgi:hypothetical protein